MTQHLASYCVCGHEKFTIALFFNISLWQCLKYLGTPCRRRLEIILPPMRPRLVTEEHPPTATEFMNVCSVLRRKLTDLVLLVLGDPYKIFVLCHCYHTARVSVLFPCMVASYVLQLISAKSCGSV